MSRTAATVMLVGMALLCIGMGFLAFAVSDLKNEVQNLQLALELSARSAATSTLVVPAPKTLAGAEEATVPGEPAGEGPSSVIPTAIIFKTKSSPRLQPQTILPVIIERVSKSKSGAVEVAIKVFTSEAASYSALDVAALFELVSLTDANARPSAVRGAFDSMPWKNAVAGSVLFAVPSGEDKVILQIVGSDGPLHYEFDFKTKTYKQVVLG